MKLMKRVAATAVATVSAGALALGAVGVATASPAAPVAGEATAECQWVHQYRVHTDGDMTDAEHGGSFVGWAIVNDIFNVRIQGNPRYYGFNVNNGKWGWILASKLSYTGNSWCA